MLYDCFVFFNEIELLKLRISTLYRYVDFFVIIEANKTQRGETKNSNFKKFENEFQQWKDKIKYYFIEDTPNLDKEKPWNIEFFQRNQICRGLTDCKPNDIVMISDLDEIPNPRILMDLNSVQISLINPNPLKERNIKQLIKQSIYLLSKIYTLFYINKIEKMPIVFQQTLSYYYINNIFQNNKWNGTIITKYKNLSTPQTLRNIRNILPCIKNGGYHFSYLGGKESIITKIRSIVEGTYINENNIESHVEECLKTGKDLYGRKNYKYKIIPPNKIDFDNIDELEKDYPNFFYNNQ